MNNSSSGGRPEAFFAGRGFYIVLFLCAAVIGISSWMMAAGNKTMENVGITNSASFDNKHVETVVIPPRETPQAAPAMAQTIIDDVQSTVESVTAMAQEEEIPDTGYIWPVMGEIDRLHDQANLHYDVTMQDWRTHDGLDICAALGEEVVASRAGRVESIDEDEFYGVVVTLDHGDGSYSIYASLSPETAVSVGDTVHSGSTLGYIGGTARCETAQAAHLHYKIIEDGESIDPLWYLP